MKRERRLARESGMKIKRRAVNALAKRLHDDMRHAALNYAASRIEYVRRETRRGGADWLAIMNDMMDSLDAEIENYLSRQ